LPTLAQVDWEVVGQVSLALAALFVFLAVVQAATQRRRTRRGAAYDVVVLDPIRLAADEFVEVSVRLITKRAQLVKTLNDENDVKQTVGRLIDDFNEGYFTFKSRVARADQSWPFDDLSDVNDEVLAVQDKITPLLATLPGVDVDFGDELDEAVASVIAVVLARAPALKKKGRLKTLRRWADQKVAVARSDDRRKRIRRKWTREYDVEAPRHRQSSD
jgi:hypothetical protein